MTDIDALTDDEVTYCTACAVAAKRAGLDDFALGIADAHDYVPVIFVAYGRFIDAGREEVTAGLTPHEAAFRLLERCLEGNACGHCGKPIAVIEVDADDTPGLTALRAICWWAYSADLKRFTPGCKGLAVVK